MAVQSIMIGGQPVLVEVVPDMPGDQVLTPKAPASVARAGTRGNVKYENISLNTDAVDAARRIEATVRAVIGPIQQAVRDVGVSEWTVELSFGFKGSAGIPFLVNGEANGSVKLSAKWKGT